jgi:hypothetical protein
MRSLSQGANGRFLCGGSLRESPVAPPIESSQQSEKAEARWALFSFDGTCRRILNCGFHTKKRGEI